MIGIINYGLGNLRSVQKAFDKLDHPAQILNEPEQVVDASHLVLPGVGAFGDGMTYLRQRGWVQPILDHAAADKPLLGICLGMQLLLGGSTEDAPALDQPIVGLGLLPGTCVEFPHHRRDERGRKLRVPHMGWNTLAWERDDPLLAGLRPGAAVYFVHSYHAPISDATSATCDYGGRFCATAWQGHTWAAQFHPEKSKAPGLQMLDNFARIR